MKNPIIALLIIFLILSGCNSIYEYEYEPRIGIYALTPTTVNGYHFYSSQGLYGVYANERDLQICVSDSKAKIWRRSGKNLEFSIFTSSGENETFNLNDTTVINFRYAGFTEPFHYYKRLFPVSSSNPTPNNEILEINTIIDTIYFQYKTASFPGIIIIDTLLYNNG